MYLQRVTCYSYQCNIRQVTQLNMYKFYPMKIILWGGGDFLEGYFLKSSEITKSVYIRICLLIKIEN